MATPTSTTHSRNIMVVSVADQSFQVRNRKRYKDGDARRKRIGEPLGIHGPLPSDEKHWISRTRPLKAVQTDVGEHIVAHVTRFAAKNQTVNP